MGLRTIGIYIATTLVAIVIGLAIVNLVKPGAGMDPDTIENIKLSFETSGSDMVTKAKTTQDAGPLQALIDIFPQNIFVALGDASMLQIIFFALFVGICLLLIEEKKAKPLIKFFS